MRVGIMSITVGPGGIVMPVIHVFINRCSQIGLNVMNKSILPFVYENTASRVQRRHDDGTGSYARRSDKIANQARQVMQFFAAFGLHLYESASYAIRPGRYLNGRLI